MRLLALVALGSLAACSSQPNNDVNTTAADNSALADTGAMPVADNAAAPADGNAAMATNDATAANIAAPAPTPSSAATATATPAAAATPVAAASPPAVFNRCVACHSTAQGAPHKIGPNLFGVYGTKAASRPGFTYSAALQASNITWNDASLDAWLKSPRQTVPGTAMAFPGLPDQQDRQAVIQYLKGLK